MFWGDNLMRVERIMEIVPSGFGHAAFADKMPKFIIAPIGLRSTFADHLYRESRYWIGCLGKSVNCNCSGQWEKTLNLFIFPLWLSSYGQFMIVLNLENRLLGGMMESLPETLAFRSQIYPGRERLFEIPNEVMMLIRYSCKDMGLSCSFVVKGETLEGVIEQALEHVREKHTQDFDSIRTPAEIERMEQALRRSTRVVPD
jgi:predicted small metal-binding protein